MKLQSRKQNIWFTSDTHFYHKNIVRGTTSWTETDRCRDFDTVEEMTAKLIENINAVVGEDDILFHLGDWSFGGIDKIWEARKQIKCKNIHLIYGNHDHHIEDNMKILPNVYEDMHSGDLKDGEPDIDNLRDIVFVYELFSSVQHYKDVSIDGIKVIMCHYPLLSWDFMSKASIMLHGHEHGNINHLNVDCKRLDAGIDSYHQIYNKYGIFSWEEIKTINNQKSIQKLGHH